MMTSYLESDIAKCLASRVSSKSMLVLNARVGNLHPLTRFALHRIQCAPVQEILHSQTRKDSSPWVGFDRDSEMIDLMGRQFLPHALKAWLPSFTVTR